MYPTPDFILSFTSFQSTFLRDLLPILDPSFIVNISEIQDKINSILVFFVFLI